MDDTTKKASGSFTFRSERSLIRARNQREWLLKRLKLMYNQAAVAGGIIRQLFHTRDTRKQGRGEYFTITV